MAENKDYSIDEILEDVRKIDKVNEADPFEELFRETKNEPLIIEDEAEEIPAEDSVFQNIEEEKKPVIQKAENSGEASENQETEESEDVRVYEKKTDDKFAFEKMYEEKKLEKERASRTRVFAKKNDKKEASDKTMVRSAAEDVSESEKKLEQEFKEKRQEKIDKFRLFTENLGEDGYDDKTEAVRMSETVKARKGEDIFDAIEKADKPKKDNSKRREKRKRRDSKVYEKIDVGRVRLRLGEDLRDIRIRLAVTAVSFVLCVVLGGAKTLYLNGRLPFAEVIFSENPIIAYAASLLLGIPALIAAVKAFFKRLRDCEKPTLGSEAMTAILFVVNLVHNSVLLLTKPEADKKVMFFGSAVCFAALLEILREKKENSMITRNLEAIIRNDTIMGVFALENESEKLASGISKAKEPMVLCAGEVEIPNSFLDSSFTRDKESTFFNVAVPLSFIMSVACGAMAFMAYGGLTAFTGAALSALLVSSPVFIAPILINLIAKTNESLNRTGCEILGYEDVENIDDTDAIVLDTADIFTGNISHFHLISKNVRIDTLHAFEIACSVLRASGGILCAEIDEFMKEQKLVLPEVEDIKYEEKLGLSCWVEDKCVLLGTEKMMREHNIEISPEYSGGKYEKEGSKVFYLAVDTYATAMFCADYFIGRQVRKQLVDLYSTGVILMLMTTDPHIDEQFVANTLGVSDSSIKTVSPVGASQIRESIGKTTRQKRTGLIFRKSVAGLLKVINAAFRLYDVQSLAFLIQIVSMVFAVVVSAVLSIAATGYLPGVLFIIAYHMIWTSLGCLVTNKNKK